MRHLDLFSGIGGFALAARWAGIKTVGFCEIDPFCRKVLAKNFPGVPIHDDIRTLSADALGDIDLITGGFPCQPVSVAGQRRGAKDDRWLWPEMVRVVDEARPRWVLGENTPGLVSMGLDACLADLEGIGYEAWAVVLPACGAGAPHRRSRVWIVAHDDRLRELQSSGSVEALRGRTGDVHTAPADNQRMGRDGLEDAAGRNVPNGQEAGWEEGADRTTERIELAGNSCGRRHGTSDRALCTGWHPAADANWWSVEPGLDRLVYGVPGRVDRLRALGNAIVPQVAYLILSEIVALDTA